MALFFFSILYRQIPEKQAHLSFSFALGGRCLEAHFLEFNLAMRSIELIPFRRHKGRVFVVEILIQLNL